MTHLSLNREAELGKVQLIGNRYKTYLPLNVDTQHVITHEQWKLDQEEIQDVTWERLKKWINKDDETRN